MSNSATMKSINRKYDRKDRVNEHVFINLDTGEYELWVVTKDKEEGVKYGGFYLVLSKGLGEFVTVKRNRNDKNCP